MPITNKEFGRRVGVHHTMASRLRAGQRMPSADLLYRIHVEFKVPADELLKAHAKGNEAMGKLLATKVFAAASPKPVKKVKAAA